MIIRNFISEENCEAVARDSKKFFLQKINELQEIIHGYRDVITIIAALPLMSDFKDKRTETVLLIESIS